MELGLFLLGVLGALIGLAGVVIPVLPGLLIVWLATAGTLLLHRADATGWVLAAVLTVLFLVGTAATIWLPTRTGRQGGASRSSFVLAGAGAVVGFFALPVLGLVVGALGGLLVGERLRLGEWPAAWQALGRVVRAYGAGVAIELAMGLVMVTLWAGAVVLRG